MKTLQTLVCALTIAAVPAMGKANQSCEFVSLEHKEYSEVALSSSGEYLAYTEISPSVDENVYVGRLFIVQVDTGDAEMVAESEPRPDPFIMYGPSWSYKSDRLAYFDTSQNGRRVAIYDPKKEQQAFLTEPQSTDYGYVNTGMVTDFQWSPDEKMIAFTVPVTRESPSGALRVDASYLPSSPGTRDVQLMGMDLSTGRLIRLAPALSGVHSFGWSPSGRQIAIAAWRGREYGGFMRTDLYIYDLDTGTQRPVVQQKGPDSTPIWSPDGRHIAFTTQAGNLDWNQHTRVGVVNVSSGQVSYPTEALVSAHGGNIRRPIWLEGSRRLVVRQQRQMAQHLFEVRLGDDGFRQLTSDGAETVTSWSLSKNGKRLAVVFQSPVASPIIEVLNYPQLKTVVRIGEETRIVHEDLTTEFIAWRSADEYWSVPGIIIRKNELTPKAPTFIVVEGGPQPILTTYNIESQYPLIELALQGYLVFSPFTRGRAGYGPAYRDAIRDNRDYMPGPAQDLLAGVDEVVRRGLADPDRLILAGFSYGGTLTAYTLAETGRFKAAAINDSGMDFVGSAFTVAANPPKLAVFKDLLGFGNVYTDGEFEALQEQSPLYRAHKITTPILFEYGSARSDGVLEGLKMYHSLVYHGVETEMWVFPRTGHGVFEPQLIRESWTRNIEWANKHVGLIGDTNAQ